MEIKKILFRKETKLVTLLLTSLLIASASAAVYYSLSMQSRTTVGSLTVKLDRSDDTPAASTVTDSWVILALKSYPNATLTYDKALDINNTDGSKAHKIRLRHVSVSPNNTAEAGNWTSIRFYLYAQNGTLIASFNYTQANNVWTVTPTQTSTYSVPASQVWYIKVETLSPLAAKVNEVLNIKMSVDVIE